MTPIRSWLAYEKRAVIFGLLAFLVLAVVLPIVAALLASLGPAEWMAQYVAPAKRYQPVLVLLAGVIAAYSSRNVLISNAFIVGLVGGAFLLLVSVAFGASQYFGFLELLFHYILVPVVLCSLGGLCVSLFRRYGKAL